MEAVEGRSPMVADGLPHLHRDDALRGHDDGRGRCHAVAEQVEDAVPLGDRVVRVGEDGVPRADAILHLLGAGDVIYAHGDEFGVEGAYLIVGLFQLAELGDADPSEMAPVEDEDDSLVGIECVGETHESALRSGELEVRRGDVDRWLLRRF